MEETIDGKDNEDVSGVDKGSISKYVHPPRRWCILCTKTKENGKLVKQSRFSYPSKPKCLSQGCIKCRVTLCIKPPTNVGRHAKLSCHDQCHLQQRLP